MLFDYGAGRIACRRALGVLAALAAAPALATTYYVSPTGSDSNAGTNPLAPWGSVAKVDAATFQPGDQILFQYGSSWDASLDASSSGTTAAPIVYGAYGSPAAGNPTFLGSNPISSSAFSLAGGTTYQTTYSTPVNWVYDNHQLTHEAQDVVGSSSPATDLSYVESTPNSFYYNSGNGQLFVNTGSTLAGQSLTLGTRADAIYSNGMNNLVFQNLNTSETAQDSGGYGIRVENSSNVRLLNSTISLSGKHAVGVIDTVGFTGINLVANGSAPDQGFGGASAFVNYADAVGSPTSTNNTAAWTNVSYVNTNGAYPVYVSHGNTGGIASIALININSLGGYGTGIDVYSTGPTETATVNGGHLDNNRSEVDTNNSVVNGLVISGGGGNLALGGSNDVLQNSTFIGNSPDPFTGNNGTIIDNGFYNTIRFNTMDVPSPSGPAIAITDPGSGTNVYGNIISPASGGGAGQTWLLFDGIALLQSNYNLVNAGNNFATGTVYDPNFLSMAQWQALGYDTSSLFGTPIYSNESAGIYTLQPGSPGIGLYTGTLNPSLTTANALLGSANANGSYNAGLNPSIWPNLNSLQALVFLNNGQTNTITPEGNTLSISSAGAIIEGSTTTLNLVGNVSNAGSLILLGGLIETGNFSNSGSVYFGASQIWSPGSSFTNTGGSATFATDAGGSIAPAEYLAMNVSGGTLNLASTQHLLSLSIAAGAKVQLTNPSGTGRSILFTPSLSVAGTLDLTGNDLVVEGGNLATVIALVKQGYNSGRWSGTGITSSAAATDPTHTTALAVIVNTTNGTTPLFGTGTALGLFDGTSPAPNDVLVKYTYYGDANLDGVVDGSDYARIDNGYLQHLTGWFNGDFNYDGVINGSDYTLIDNAFNTQGQSLNASITAQIATSAAVPEPRTGDWTAVLLIAILSRRRRTHLQRDTRAIA